ncbi:4-hydroxybenzoate octaprenyltransferase [Megalodesulfovibrio gigas]|uniref:4-hydroxybenzoate polyprenyltransferase n=1 Tax=Megalodesulfovibrio gigas (strain ATCC 19364 / DSM 1382 / NCIMB 9332 / VKM B-1759) TaxID=1121448 RepID=T2G9T9_MEGG1|nr:4-hydroxybenzoate octaprenyltransferase [Megalodesulfovibrio gigas]AGW13360.1 putative 4-hydroxybenzoate octaprenyltransferase [Megalodesulfovibrio gigas DSM 1382 = ATCC 19364]
MKNILSAIAVLCRMVKIEHSVFALPFAYLGAFVAAGGWPGWQPFALLTIAMVAVRSFAMACNRLVDVRYDRENPRTKGRPLVTGEITPVQTQLFLLATALVFVAACAGLNRLCLVLSPAALALSVLYSYTKRFTWLCHFVLGLVIGLAPAAGWIAVQPDFAMPAALWSLGVLFWVAGFDLLYACQDVDFDRRMGLYSLPAAFGIPTTLAVSTFSHAVTAIFFLLAGWGAGLGWPYFAAWGLCSALLLWEHTLVKADDLSRLTLAFFTLNGVISIALFAGALWSLLQA